MRLAKSLLGQQFKAEEKIISKIDWSEEDSYDTTVIYDHKHTHDQVHLTDKSNEKVAAKGADKVGNGAGNGAGSGKNKNKVLNKKSSFEYLTLLLSSLNWIYIDRFDGRMANLIVNSNGSGNNNNNDITTSDNNSDSTTNSIGTNEPLNKHITRLQEKPMESIKDQSSHAQGQQQSNNSRNNNSERTTMPYLIAEVIDKNMTLYTQMIEKCLLTFHFELRAQCYRYIIRSLSTNDFAVELGSIPSVKKSSRKYLNGGDRSKGAGAGAGTGLMDKDPNIAQLNDIIRDVATLCDGQITLILDSSFIFHDIGKFFFFKI